METFEEMILDTENLITPLNRAHRLVLGTRMEVVEQVSGRI
jgi:hypothetical protein